MCKSLSQSSWNSVNVKRRLIPFSEKNVQSKFFRFSVEMIPHPLNILKFIKVCAFRKYLLFRVDNHVCQIEKKKQNCVDSVVEVCFCLNLYFVMEVNLFLAIKSFFFQSKLNNFYLKKYEFNLVLFMNPQIKKPSSPE